MNSSPRKQKWPRKIRLMYMRQFPRRKKMHGGFLHKMLGERLFDKSLWKPSRTTVAGGIALGLFIGLLPTFSLQIILSLVFSYLLRLNISAAVLGTLITNPLTTPAIVVLQYKLGVLLVGSPDPDELTRYSGAMKIILGHGKPFMMGSMVSALAAGLMGYFLTMIFWVGVTKLEDKAKHLRKKDHIKSHP